MCTGESRRRCSRVWLDGCYFCLASRGWGGGGSGAEREEEGEEEKRREQMDSTQIWIYFITMNNDDYVEREFCVRLWRGTTDNTHLNTTVQGGCRGDFELYKRCESYSMSAGGDCCFPPPPNPRRPLPHFSPPHMENERQPSD